MSKKIMTGLVVFLLFWNNNALAQDQKVFVNQFKNPDNSVEFKYTKEAIGHYFVQINLENVENIDSSILDKPHSFNLSNDSGTLFKISPLDASKYAQCSYTFNYKLGTLDPDVNNQITYLLPFKKNKKVTIYELTRFDINPDIWRVYSYYSKSRDTIFGMRKGTVVDIKKIAAVSPIKSNEKPATIYRTEVIVEHADGTNASYTGLDEKSLQVKLGHTIYPQTIIGVMDDFKDSNNDYNFRFNVYYYSYQLNNNSNEKKPKIIEKTVSSNFLTETGRQKLDIQKDYIVKCYDEVLFYEMTNEEKAKYFSNPQVF